jgi:serine protease Do
MSVQPVTPELAQRMDLDRSEGLVITAVKRGSAAEEAGLRSGDVITQMNRRPVKNLADYNRELTASDQGKSILLLVRRGQASIFLALKR